MAADGLVHQRPAFLRRRVGAAPGQRSHDGLLAVPAKGPTSCEFNFGEKGFVHMGAVVEDHGAWDDFADYVASPAYAA
jgi:hypothetical protein